MEHLIEPGPLYKLGVCGLRTAIIGHSHYISEPGEADRESFTDEVLGRVREGEKPLRFFSSIARAFNDESTEFFKRVLFFNFIPNVVSSQNHWGTNEQIEAGVERLERLLDVHEPQLAIAFSTKIWWALHYADPQSLIVLDEPSGWIAAKQFRACELVICRHPQGASSHHLSTVVNLARERAQRHLGR